MLGSAQPGKAQATIDRPVTIYVAGTAGGGIDLYARLLARHIGRHIPSKPNVTVQVMPGAGGIRAAKFFAEQAPRDGTAIAAFANGPIIEPLIGARNPGYDMSKFTWIGAVTKDVGLCVSFATTPFKTIEDVKKQQMVVGGTGAGSETDTWPIVLNDVLGTKFKLVTGYLGSQETILAMERGETHGRCVFSHSALKIAKPDWLRDKTVTLIVQFALQRHPELPDIPTAVELARNDEERAVLSAVMNASEVGTAFFTTPGVPPERLAVLRRAFDETMQDPEFLAEAERIRLDVTPMRGEEVQKLVAQVSGLSPALLERVRAVYPAAGAN